MSNMPVNPPSWRNDTVLPLPNEVTANAWAVDAACSGNPGPMDLPPGEGTVRVLQLLQLFHLIL